MYNCLCYQAFAWLNIGCIIIQIRLGKLQRYHSKRVHCKFKFFGGNWMPTGGAGRECFTHEHIVFRAKALFAYFPFSLCQLLNFHGSKVVNILLQISVWESITTLHLCKTFWNFVLDHVDNCKITTKIIKTWQSLLVKLSPTRLNF